MREPAATSLSSGLREGLILERQKPPETLPGAPEQGETLEKRLQRFCEASLSPATGLAFATGWRRFSTWSALYLVRIFAPPHTLPL